MRVTCQFHAPAALDLGLHPPVPMERQAGWTPEPIGMAQSRHKCLVLAENWATIPRTLDMHPSHTSVAKCLLHRQHSPSALYRPTTECCLGKYGILVDYDIHKKNIN